MNVRAVLYVISLLVALTGICILLCLPVSMIMNDHPTDIAQLAASGFLPVIIGIFGYFIWRPREVMAYQYRVREGFGIVTMGWIAASLAGCFPYIFVSGFTFYDAFFETVSGFTTTGSSVIDNTLVLFDGSTLRKGLDDLPRGLIFWRSVTHWLGGMGIVVLSLAILPFLKVGGQQLFNAEASGISKDQLAPRIASTAKILWGVYVLLTIAEVFFLMLGGMPLFDSLCNSFGTIATGGFSNLQTSIGGYDNAYFDVVITIFMFLSGCNFILHFRALQGKALGYFRDEELRCYFFLTVFAIFAIAYSIMGSEIITSAGKKVEGSFLNSLRYSSFQVVSLFSTTGFATADFDLWPTFPRLFLVSLMFIGGCGGSTSGGIKNSRMLVTFKYGISQVSRCLFPKSVTNIRFNHERLDNSIVHKVLSFFFIYIMVFLISSFLIAILTNTDIITATTGPVACLGGVGPGLSKVGPACTFAWMNWPAKMVLCADMILGRLEIYTALVIFLPHFWKK